MYNEELHNLYNSQNIIRMIKTNRIRLARNVARMGDENAHKIVVGKPKGKRPLGRLRCRCKDNIKMDLRETGWEGVVWIRVAQDRDRWRVL
jgi:hypothetical protein